MAVDIVVPQLGESVVDATLARWLKAPGEMIQPGEAVVALETDKVDLDVPAENGGVLTEVLRNEGDTVLVGEVLGRIDETATAAAPAPPAAAPAPPVVEPPQAEVPQAEPPQTPQPSAQPLQPPPSARPPLQPAPSPPPPAAAAPASPLARSIAEKEAVDISRVAGSGPGGRVTRTDVEGYLGRREPSQPAAAPAQPAAAPAGDRPEERRRMSRRRQTIATRLVEAQHTAAMLTTFNEVDMSAVMAIRSVHKESFKERHGVGLGFMSFFTKAAVSALKAFPLMNAEIQGDEIVLKGYYDIGVAVSTDEGLVVPVVRDADRRTFAEIESAIADLATRAREGRLTLPELQDGTFTITNGGIFGSLLSTPILNAPQVGILGMHKIEQRPVAVDGNVVVRPMMYLALSYDHRVVDGAEAVRFLVHVKQMIEDPAALLIEG